MQIDTPSGVLSTPLRRTQEIMDLLIIPKSLQTLTGVNWQLWVQIGTLLAWALAKAELRAAIMRTAYRRDPTTKKRGPKGGHIKSFWAGDAIRALGYVFCLLLAWPSWLPAHAEHWIPVIYGIWWGGVDSYRAYNDTKFDEMDEAKYKDITPSIRWGLIAWAMVVLFVTVVLPAAFQWMPFGTLLTIFQIAAAICLAGVMKTEHSLLFTEEQLRKGPAKRLRRNGNKAFNYTARRLLAIATITFGIPGVFGLLKLMYGPYPG